MQDGSVTVEQRKRGPDVWCFRWRERGTNGEEYTAVSFLEPLKT
jgi:hypothetical protein